MDVSDAPAAAAVESEIPPEALLVNGAHAPHDAAPAADDERADLGILLVHGIGEQKQGETLTAFAEPIIEWVRDWLYQELPSGSSFASVPVSGQLKAPLLPPDEPAHADVLIGTQLSGQTEAEAQRWLFAEAWWGAQVLVPPIAGFTSWLLTRGSWVLLLHIHQRWVARPSFGKLMRGLACIATALVWLPVSLLMNALLLLASLVALIPVGKVRQVVYTALRAMTGVVGDSYVLIRNPIQRIAFTEVVVKGLEWLRGRCKKLAVISHSQGAAVAHGALRRDDAPAADLLVTVGAGIAKLEALRLFEQKPANERVAASLAAPLLLAASAVWLRVRYLGLDDALYRVIAPGVLALFGLTMLLVAWLSVVDVLRRVRRRSDWLDLSGVQPQLTWSDFYTLHDPVPGGSLQCYFDLPKVNSTAVSVLDSMLRDHTSYWSARATFLPKLVECLGRCSQTTLFTQSDADERLQRGDASHRKSLTLLKASKWFDGLALLLACTFGASRLDKQVDALRKMVIKPDGKPDDDSPFVFLHNAMLSVEHAIAWTVRAVTGDQADWAHGVVNKVVGALVLLLLLIGWKRIAFPMWQTWAGNRYEDAVRGQNLSMKKPDDEQSRKDRAAQLAASWILNAVFGVVIALPLAVSLLWLIKPEWMGERQLYGALASAALIAISVFMAVMFVVDMVNNLLEAWAALRHRLHGPRGRGAVWWRMARVWFRRRDRVLGRLIMLAVPVIALAYVFSSNREQVEGSAFGWFMVAFVAWVFAGQFEELWRRLRRLHASTWRRWLAMAAPVVVFAFVVTLSVGHGEKVLDALLSAAGLTWLSLMGVNALHRAGRLRTG